MRALLAALDKFLEAARLSRRDRELRRLIEVLERALAAAFREQGEEFMSGFEELRNEYETAVAAQQLTLPGWEALFDRLPNASFVSALNGAVLQALILGGDELMADVGLGISFDLANPRAVEYIRAHGAELVARINDTTRGQLRSLLERGMAEGWSYDKMAREMTKRWQEFAEGRPQEHIDSRAHGIAVTEMGNAYCEGSYQAAEQLRDAGLEMEKSWMTVGDDRVSELCAGNEAEGWIPIDQPHRSGHMHPLGHPYCRCDELYRRKRAESEGSEE